MTTNQLIAQLKPLRMEIHKADQHIDSMLLAGRSADGAFERWRNAVRAYLAELERARDDTDLGKLESRIHELSARLDTGFGMEVPDSTVRQWELDKHFEKLLAELEVCSDVYAGHQATRQWLLGVDARLRWTMRQAGQRSVVQPEPKLEQEVTA